MLKLLMSWDIRENHEQAHLEFITSELVPMLMKHGKISDVWLSMAGNSPEMIVGIISDDDVELRMLPKTDEWQSIHEKLEPLIDNFRLWLTSKIQNPGGFQM